MTMISPTPMRRAFAMLLALATLPLLATSLHAQLSNPVKLFKGVITDETTGKPLDGGRLIVYEGTSTEKVTSSKINPGTGAFQMILNPSVSYRFLIRSPRYYNTEYVVTTPPGSNYEEISKNFTAKPIPIGTPIYSGRLFAPNSSSFANDPAFTQTLELLKKQPTILFTLTLTPDGSFAAPAAAKPAKAKKGKKGATAQPAATTTPAPSGPTPEQQLQELGSAQVQQLKDLFKREKISLTRITWDIKPGVKLTTPAKGAKPALKPNVQLTIKGISSEEDDEES